MSVPSGIAETHHPMTDDAGATTALSSSGGKNVGWEKPQSSMPQVETRQPALTRESKWQPQGRLIHGSIDPHVGCKPGQQSSNSNDLTVLVETINQKWDGLAIRLARMEQHQHATEQAQSQPPLVEVKQLQGPAPAGHHPATSAMSPPAIWRRNCLEGNPTRVLLVPITNPRIVILQTLAVGTNPLPMIALRI